MSPDGLAPGSRLVGTDPRDSKGRLLRTPEGLSNGYGVAASFFFWDGGGDCRLEEEHVFETSRRRGCFRRLDDTKTIWLALGGEADRGTVGHGGVDELWDRNLRLHCTDGSGEEMKDWIGGYRGRFMTIIQDAMYNV